MKYLLLLILLLLCGCLGLPWEVSEESVEIVKNVADATGTKLTGYAVGTGVAILTALGIVKVKKKGKA